MFLSLYTDKAKGVLSEQRFMKLTTAMEQKQEENQCRLQELMRMLQQSDAQESQVRTFIREIRQYATIQELDETVLNLSLIHILRQVWCRRSLKMSLYMMAGALWYGSNMSRASRML